ncbi:SDR family NAD(P)-dependent oxidoreductase [Brevundimonas sp.]|jgi:NAD(P)-dependent dehydrogenase (short-subunit alcohol dehydrogenase family)|uniref:SDR family NAD(P)-dependent oxidoreductase n=1 Tax=Brevundimonas sp. TaxID=1871086 RepID=UPI0037BE47B1
MSLKDQAIIVTGGASGIGHAAALELARQGANLIVADFDIDGAQKAAAEAEALGVKAFAFKVDVSDPAAVEAMVDFAVEKLGTLTGVFNNAGISKVQSLLEMDPASYRRVIEVDQFSVYYGLYYGARKMVELGVKGVIVNTASIYGSVAAKGSFNYNAAKAAVIAMTRSGALELAEHGIRVAAVAPGFIDTPMMKNVPDEARAALAAQHVTNKLIAPEKVASVVAFLFSDAADAVNGSTVAADDGFLAFKV